MNVHQQSVHPQSRPIGPGRIVLVVGPSGVGKDTLIAEARVRLGHLPHVAFPRRVVARATGGHEDYISVSIEEFKDLEGRGHFAMSWRAHGNAYGIPSVMFGDLMAGTTVVCNVSRTVIGLARQTFANVRVIEVSASPVILADRIAARDRESPKERDLRLARSRLPEVQSIESDIKIDNSGALDVSIVKFCDALLAR